MDYLFHCENPRCQKTLPLEGKPQTFLDQCRAKGMELVMLACPACGWSQAFNPQEPDGKKQKRTKEKKLPPQQDAVKLPDWYLSWLDGLGRKRTVMFDDGEWELATAKQLAKDVTVDGNRGSYLERARLFAKTLAEIMPHAVDTQDQPFPFERIEQFLTIGTDNEDLLCVDPGDNFSVWRFAPSEGGYVERLTDSLRNFMQEATS